MFYNKKFRLMGIAATLELDVGHGVKPWALIVAALPAGLACLNCGLVEGTRIGHPHSVLCTTRLAIMLLN